MMKVKTNKKAPSGEAKVRMRGDQIQILMKDADKPFIISKDAAPDYIKPGTWYVVMNQDETEILSARPMIGQFRVKFKKFAADDGELPAPRFNEGGPRKTSDGRSYVEKPYQSMIAIMVVTHGDFKGMEIPAFLRYLFENDGNDGVAVVGGGKRAESLIGFLTATGLIEHEIQFSDNILPKLQKLALKLDREFYVTLKNGYIQDFIPMEDMIEDETDEGWEDEKLTPWDDENLKSSKDDDEDW